MSGQAGLISTHVYHSFRWRCVNFGHWRSLEDFTAIQTLLFSSFTEMLDLANNEYQKTLYEVIFTT
ncbi:MAG: hypothetical protein HC903_05925 [Methylacidiphilales bacterium]|nr:hypothetical protein [Candidatus Methylacidiphilales bacterium]